MANTLFTAGSCQKSQFYDVLLNAMLAAGWQNITSNYATDGDVLYSTGVSGEKSLYMQLCPYNAGLYGFSAANDTAYSIRTKPQWTMGLRLIKSYSPGASGTAGTFSPAARGAIPFCLGLPQGATNITTVNAPLDVIVSYYICVDKNKLILFTKLPDQYSINWMMNYIGLPDTQYAKMDNSRGMCWTSSCSPAAFAQSNVVYMAEYPDENGGTTSGDNYYLATPLTIQPTSKSPNQNEKLFLSEVFTHNDAYGMIGKLDGLLGTFKSNITSGDTITIDGVTYTLLNCTKSPDSYFYYASYYYGIAYPSGMQTFAIRVG